MVECKNVDLVPAVSNRRLHNRERVKKAATIRVEVSRSSPSTSIGNSETHLTGNRAWWQIKGRIEGSVEHLLTPIHNRYEERLPYTAQVARHTGNWHSITIQALAKLLLLKQCSAERQELMRLPTDKYQTHWHRPSRTSVSFDFLKITSRSYPLHPYVPPTPQPRKIGCWYYR
jgi:hypothetical protein